MIHLTFTGFYAGVTLCGAERNDQDTYSHAMYTPWRVLEGSDVCPKCKRVWDEADEKETR